MAKVIPPNILVINAGSVTPYNIAPDSFTNFNALDPANGGVFQLNYTAWGFMFIGTVAAGGSSFGTGSIAFTTVPPNIPLEASSNGFADGIQLNQRGDWFRLNGPSDLWYIGTKDTGSPGSSYIVAAIVDECAFFGPLP